MKHNQLVNQFGKYGITGIAANGLSYAVFLILIYSGMNPIVSSGLCYLLGVSISYAGNRYWAFKSTNPHSDDLPRYLFAYLAGLVFALLSMAVLVRWMHPALAQILTIAMASVVIFFCLKATKFGQSRSGDFRQSHAVPQNRPGWIARIFLDEDKNDARD